MASNSWNGFSPKESPENCGKTLHVEKWRSLLITTLDITATNKLCAAEKRRCNMCPDTSWKFGMYSSNSRPSNPISGDGDRAACNNKNTDATPAALQFTCQA